MDKKILITVGAILLLSAFLSAFEFQPSQDSITISCNTGKAFFFVKNNDEAEKEKVAFSANLGQLTGHFEPATADLEAKSATSTFLYLNAPDDLQGIQDVTVTAQACTKTKCTTKQIIQKVFLNACKNPARFLQPTNDNLVLEPKSIYFTHYDNPTDYSAILRGPRTCTQATVNQPTRIKATLTNTGPAATFDLQLAGETDLAKAELSRSYVNLQRNEEKDFYVYLKPVQSGSFYVTIRALQNQGTVVEQEVCINSQDDYSSTITMPTVVEARNCEDLYVNGSIKNTGTNADFYDIRTSNGLPSEEQILVNKGEEKKFFVWLQNPAEGQTTLETSVTSKSGLQAKALTKITSTSCTIPVTVTQPQEPATLLANVENTLDTPLENVTLELTGIPSNWTYQAETAASIPPRSNKTMAIKLVQTTNEEAANPQLVIKSNGKQIATQKLSPIKPTSGLFTANASQTAILLGILLVVVALAVWANKNPKKEEEIKDRLAKIRAEVSKKEESGKKPENTL